MRVQAVRALLAVALIAACGSEASPPEATDTSQSEPTTSVPTTPSPSDSSTAPSDSETSTREPSPTAEPPSAESDTLDDDLALLVPAPEGLAFWQADRVEWLVTDRPVAAAVPDLTGGVLYQYVDPAEPEWVWDEGSHRWVATWPVGGPEPILRQRTPGGPNEVAVPASGSRLWLLDAGLVDGEPAVAFGRLVGGDEPIAIGFPHCAESDMCGEFSWRVELAVRPIDGGEERILHPALWQPGITESTAHTARLGHGLVSLSVHPYPGDSEGWGAVELLDRAGDRVDADYRASPWCTGCDVVADLAPSSPALAYVERYHDAGDERSTSRAEVVLVDITNWTERWRIDIDGGETIDTDGDRVVVATDSDCADDIGPELGPGDEGPWVARLQLQLNRFIDAGLDTDGRYGPATEEAVRAWQLLNGMPTTGAVEAFTWGRMLPDRSCTTDLVVVDEGQSSPVRLDIGWSVRDVDPWSGVAHRGPALWVGPTPQDVNEPLPTAPSPTADIDELPILAPDGLGSFVFGADADDVQVWLAEQLGEPDTAVVEPGRGGWPLESCNERRFSYWADAGFTVGFTDLNSYDVSGTVADCDDAPHLEGWYVAEEGSPWFAQGHGGVATTPIEVRLTTSDGIGLSSTAGELRAAEPGVTFGEWDLDEYAPAVFRTSSGMRGRVEWDPVAEVQSALNEHGATLAVDGAFGPRTEAALAEFQSAHGIDEHRLGPLTLQALGVAVPESAPIVYLAGGTWDWGY